MKVFLSWSGARSKFLAETLRWWLPRVIQSVQPWMSDEDISAGSRWSSEIATELAQAKLGIICVTPGNQNSSWLLFEAGALSKTLDKTYVCPFLFELPPSQLTGPLAQFQANEVNREGAYKIVTLLNRSLASAQLPLNDLDETFDVWWPRFEAKLKDVPSADEDRTPKRTDEELLEEIVSNTREQLRRENLRVEQLQSDTERFNRVLEILDHMGRSLGNMPTLLKQLPVGTSIPTIADLASMSKLSTENMQTVASTMRDSLKEKRLFTDSILKGQPDDKLQSD